MALRLLLFAAAAVAAVRAEPYIIHSPASDVEPTFALCSGREPSAKLRASLLFCRELSYTFCVNSSLVGSILRVDSPTAQHFAAVLAEPTHSSVEHLAWLVDSSLVLLYDTFSTRSNAGPKCAYEWHAWLCSTVFRRAHGNTTKDAAPLPVGVCPEVCTRAEDACDADLECDLGAAAAAAAVPTATAALVKRACTDYYNDSVSCNAFNSRHASIDNEQRRAYGDDDDGYSGGVQYNRHRKHGGGSGGGGGGHGHGYHSAGASRAVPRFAILILIALCALSFEDKA